MIRWCAFCQTYIGESAPFDDYQLTHGICEECLKKARAKASTPAPDSLKTIQSFYVDLWTRAKNGEEIDANEVADRGRELKIAPADLLIGAIQPLLYRVGQAWENREITEKEEQKFTRMVSLLLERLRADESLEPIESDPPEFMVGSIDGNRHILGPQFIHYALIQRGIRSRIFLKKGSNGSWIQAIEETRPAMLGLSISMHDTDDEVRTLLEQILDTYPQYSGRIILGGLGSLSLPLPENIQKRITVYDGKIGKLVEWIKSQR